MSAETTYEEQALTQVRNARRAAAEAGAAKLAKAMNTMSNIGELEVLAINTLRAAGQDFNTVAGREQLNFDALGMAFARREILPHLPAGVDMKHVRLAVHLASLLPEPIRTTEELRAVKREVQQMLSVFELADAPRRRELQSAHARNLFADFVSRTASLRVLFDDLRKEEPMESWPADKLDEFLENAKPVKETIAQAEKLRLGLQV